MTGTFPSRSGRGHRPRSRSARSRTGSHTVYVHGQDARQCQLGRLQLHQLHSRHDRPAIRARWCSTRTRRTGPCRVATQRYRQRHVDRQQQRRGRGVLHRRAGRQRIRHAHDPQHDGPDRQPDGHDPGSVRVETGVVSVHSRDAAGNWGPFATVNLTVDNAGPVTSGVTANPGANNGSYGQSSSNPSVRVSATFNDTPSGGGTVAAGEGFIDPVGPPPTGPASPSSRPTASSTP